MLLCAALLSLGAPFWFRMLQALTALRSVIARKEDAQKQAGAGVAWRDGGRRA